MKGNIIQKKSYEFAIRIVRTCTSIRKEQKEFDLSRQLLRSGTSIGANVEEAIGAQSRKDFYAKLSIAYKEARETKFWIRLLIDTNFLHQNKGESLLHEIEEILMIIGRIRQTMKGKS